MYLPVSILLAIPALGQVRSAVDSTAAAYESLLRLRTTATVLHITAHPDDEDGGLLTWLARSRGARTGLLTLTRGEGGANLIGPELFDALGILRTEELLAADRYYGVDQFFTRAADFGFSKRLDETMEHWGEQNTLADCVRVVRLYRPDVIIARFRGDPRDGHGNHQAAGKLAAEVFRAAADPLRFPEQLREGLRPWQAKKLYRSASAAEPGAIEIDTGVYNPLLGESYRQLASEGLRFQRSQGSGLRPAAPGPAISALLLLDSAMTRKPERDTAIFDGIDTSLIGLAALAPLLHLEIVLEEVAKDIAAAIDEFDARDPSRVIGPHLAPALRNLRAIIENVRDSEIDPAAKYDLLFRLRNKEEEMERAAGLLAGVSFEAQADGASAAIPGHEFSVAAIIVNRSSIKMENVRVEFSKQSASAASIGYNQPFHHRFTVTLPDSAEITRPYWSRKDPYRDAIYQLDDPRDAGLPFAPPPFEITARYEIDGVGFHITKPVDAVSIDPVLGEQHRLLTVVPAIGIGLTPERGVISAGRKSIEMEARVISNTASADATVHLELPPGWRAVPAEAPLHFTHQGEIQSARFRVSIPETKAGDHLTIRAVADSGGREYREGYQMIAHPDLEPRALYRPAESDLTTVDVKIAPGLNVGYVMGVGDEIPEALEQIGVQVRMLSASDLAAANLTPFDAIVIGVRASAVRPDYAQYNSRLLDYVKNGGNLIVEYQTSEFDAVPYGPFRFHMGRNPEEVSEEDAKVTILDPSNPVFNAPNRITAADFDGWVEERGSKFMSEWAPEYTPLLECHDRGQRPQKGGLLQAHYGKGTFTYAAYAFYRQLPAAVPGAYRLFANLIGAGKK